MKLTWGNWRILAVVAACSACAPEQLALGDAPLEAGGGDVGGTSSNGGTTSTPGGAATSGGKSGLLDCVSPTQHPERGYDEGVTFCACDDEEAQCVDSRPFGGPYVGFICQDGAWATVNDGPCGVEQGECFSPTQNPEHAYDEGAMGCACEGEADQCVNVDGRLVGLVCEGGAWVAVDDGPCGVEQGECFSPTQNPEHAYDEGAIGCACEGDADLCVDVDDQLIALVCADGAWTAVEDGPCYLDVCQEGSFSARRCIQCGPAGDCAITEVGCFTDPGCEDGVCGMVCF